MLTALLLALLAPANAAATSAIPPAASGVERQVAGRIAVTVVGKGPDVLLIPGLASSAGVWSETAAHLKAGHRVHLIQVDGFGGAPAAANADGPVLDPVVAAVHAYIAGERLKAPAVIGHSLGGLIGMKLALAHPSDVGRLMIVDSLPFFGAMFGPQTTVATVEPRAKAMRDAVIAGTQEAYAAGAPQTMARMVKSKGPMADAALAATQASDKSVVARAMYDDFVTDLRGQVGAIAAPVTVLYAYDASTGMPQAMADGLFTSAYAPVKQARVKRIDGSYHFIMLDQPQAFLKEVDDFLR